MSKCRGFSSSIVCAIPALVALAVPAAAQDANTQVLKAALIANQANLDGLPTYKCRYTLTKATAESQAAALRGQYNNVRACESILVVDRGKEKYQALADGKLPPAEQAVKGPDGKMSVSVDFIPICDLRLNDQMLSYFGPFQNASVQTSKSPPLSELTPLTMMCIGQGLRTSPAAMFLNGRAREPAVFGRGQMELDGHVVVHVRAKAISIDDEYYFDPSQGYLPLKMVQHCEPPWSGEKHDVILHLLSAKECSRSRWFPMKWLQIHVYPNRAAVELVELRVTEFEPDKKPTDEDFSIVLPAGTLIQGESENARVPRKSFRLRQQEKVTPDDIPRLAEMLDNVGKVPLMDTAIARPGLLARAKWPLIGAAVALLAVAAFIYLRPGQGRSKLARP
ncbi:MAG: hypothetical protein L0Y72_17015 [Gemmataceae bacterium]|nr:hypothetical protein [Gemmataceae bacterium]